MTGRPVCCKRCRRILAMSSRSAVAREVWRFTDDGAIMRDVELISWPVVLYCPGCGTRRRWEPPAPAPVLDGGAQACYTTQK